VKTLIEYIDESILGEEEAIALYKEFIAREKEQGSKAIVKTLEEILGDEEDHLKILNQMLKDYQGVK
jgi:bacterioferritin (cytochrome b1)